jgi:hypothetical protein
MWKEFRVNSQKKSTVRFTSALAAAWAAVLAACTGHAPVAQGPTPALSGQVRTWEDYKHQAALRITRANPGQTFSGTLPDPLRSIPVLQVQLRSDGSVRQIVVLRTPKNVPETVEMAREAVLRAAPFGPVGHLPQPWQFSETFLYNDELKFQLRTLAESP